MLTANHYRNPGQLAPGGVLVVGASASGVQIADELARAGREVVLAVGRHTRLPRSYRGLDVFWWLEATGRLARTIDDVPDPVAARRETSLQLVGRNHPMRGDRDLDLGTLQARGVRLAGRVDEITGHVARFRDDLAGTVQAADRTDAPVPRRRRPARPRDRTDRRGLVARPSAARPGDVEPDPARPARRADRHGPAGDGLRARPPVATAPDHRAGRLDPATPRGHPCPGRVRRRAAVPAPPGLGVHRRRTARRPGRGRAPAGQRPRRPPSTACSGGECAS